MKRRTTGRIVGVAACFFWHAGLAQSGCDAILKDGTFDLASNYSNQQLAYAFASWWESASHESNSASKSAGHKGKVGIVDFLQIKGSFNTDEQKIQAVDKRTAAYLATRTDYAGEVATWARQASSVIATAWNNCMNSNGLFSSVAYSGNPNRIHLVFRYRTPGHDTAKLQVVKPSRGTGITCDPQPSGGFFSRAIAIDASQTTVTCTRDEKYQRMAGEITVSLSQQAIGPVIFTLKAVPTTPAVTGVACEKYRETRAEAVACNEDTATGYYWRVGRKLAHYSVHGPKSDGTEPPCNDGNLNATGMTARFPLDNNFYQRVAGIYTPADPRMTAPKCNYVGNGRLVTDKDLSMVCGIFEAICTKQDPVK